MSIKNMTTFIVLAFTLAATTAQGQISDSSDEQKAYTVRFYLPKITGFITDNTKLTGADKVYYFDGEKEQSIRLIPGQRSGRIEIVSNGEIVLYTREKTTDPKTGQETIQRKPYLETNLSPDWDSALILVSRARTATGGRKGFPMRYDPGHIPNGAVRVINLTSNQIAILHKGAKTKLKPRGSQVYRSLDSDAFKFAMAEYRDKEWKRALRIKRSVDAETGNLAIVVPRSKRGGLHVHMFNGM